MSTEPTIEPDPYRDVMDPMPLGAELEAAVEKLHAAEALGVNDTVQAQLEAEVAAMADEAEPARHPRFSVPPRKWKEDDYDKRRRKAKAAKASARRNRR